MKDSRESLFRVELRKEFPVKYSTDIFLQKINRLETPVGAESYNPIEADERLLCGMRLDEVFIEDHTKQNPNIKRRYFKNIVPEIPSIQCEICSNVFLLDEYEFAYMEMQCCPFCRTKETDEDILAKSLLE